MLSFRSQVPRTAVSSWRTLFLLLLAGAMAACAREPQIVFISPELAGPPDRIAEQPRIDLAVKDGRATPIIGSRGGSIDELATISTKGDITPAIAQELTEELVKQGYAVVAKEDGADVALEITLEELTYQTGGTVLTEIKISSTVGVTATKGDRTMTSRYRTRHTEEFATAPDEEKNSELINMVVGKSLEQMLADEELRDFMAN